MKIHLVRHARAIQRGQWLARSEQHRPLCEEGFAQAHALVEHCSGSSSPRRLIASSTLHCRQTLEPLSLAAGLPIELDERLADTSSPQDLIELVEELADTPAVLCSHAVPIRALLAFLGIADESESGELACRKGSVWTLEGSGGFAVERAVYLEPGRAHKRRSRPAVREIVWPQSLRAAVLDMGSTSFTLLVGDVDRQGAVRPVVRKKVMLRLGAAVADHGKLSALLTREAIDVARSLHETATREKAEEFRAVATASLRDARNGRKVGDKIARAIGAPVDILDGKTEARLMFRAFQERLSLGAQPVLGLDLGGGSLELAVGCGSRIDYECTLGLGAVRLHSEIVSSDPVRRREVRRIRERVERELAPHRERLLMRRPSRLVVAGGTPRAIARLVAARRDAIPTRDSLPMALDLERLRATLTKLMRSTHDERLDGS